MKPSGCVTVGATNTPLVMGVENMANGLLSSGASECTFASMRPIAHLAFTWNVVQGWQCGMEGADRVVRRAVRHQPGAHNISLRDGADYANTERFQGSVPLLPDLCSLSVP